MQLNFPEGTRSETMKMPAANILRRGIIPAGICILTPATLLAAEEGAGEGGALLMAGRIFNICLVAFVLVWIGRKPLLEFFASRTQSIREQLEAAESARKEAEARLEEMQARMSNLDRELQEIRDAAEGEARAEYQRLVAEAERDAEKIVARARQEIEGMTRSAHQELKAHAADLAVQLAEEKIRKEISDEDQARLFGGIVRQLGGRG